MADSSSRQNGDRRASIAGIGLATPLGIGAEATWRSLLEGRYINDHARVPLECADRRGRVVPLAMCAVSEAIAAAGWSDDELRDDQTALVVGTSKGPVESWLAPLSHMERAPYVAGGLHLTGLSEVASELARRLGLGLGPRLTISAACASGLGALIRGAIMIHCGEADRVLVVAAESSLHPIFLASFQRLGVLSSPDVGCRPFDQHRQGFLMSEAAAAICLTNARMANAVVIDRFALGGDAQHLTAADPSGATLRRLLADVLDGRPIDLIHGHGTGTLQNDPIELAALDESIRDCTTPPVLYSHKGAIGHSLGAAGLVATAISCLIHQRSIIPGNVRTHAPLPANRLILSTQPVRRAVNRSLVYASGFGGATAAITLENA